MYKKIIYFLFIILLSCSSDKNIKIKKKEELQSAEFLYTTALNEYEEGKLQSAIDFLKTIESNYSYSRINQKSILMIAYIYYEGNDYIKSLEYLKKFKNTFPASKYFSYAEFLIGLCLYDQINIVSKDQTNTALALQQFNKIIKEYPNSLYAQESKVKIDLINEQLAGHEMYIARYYISKEKWISAILRLQIVIEKYQSTIFIDEALHRMVEINYRLGNLETAKKYASILGYNYNSSDWYKKTYKIVGDKKYSILNDEKKRTIKDKLLSIFNISKND